MRLPWHDAWYQMWSRHQHESAFRMWLRSRRLTYWSIIREAVCGKIGHLDEGDEFFVYCPRCRKTTLREPKNNS